MDDLEKIYGKQTFVLYALFAKVPGKKVWPRRIFLVFSTLILLWALVVQVLTIAKEKFHRAVLIELLPTTVSVIGCLFYIPYVKYAMEKDFKTLLSMMITDLKDERTEIEESIKRHYYRNANIFVTSYSIITYIVMAGMFLTGCLPRVLDFLLPLNETRGRQFLVRAEFIIDEDKYYYQIYFLECCTALVITTLIVNTENMGIIIGQHACGMTAVLGHRLETLTDFEDEKVLEKDSYERLTTNRFRRCIEGQQQLGHFVGFIAAFYDVPLTLVLAATACALIVSLVQMTNPELMSLTNILFTIVQVIQLFILSYLGQCGINYANLLRMNAYNLKWYLCTPSQRKLLQLIIVRASKPCVITARNMYTLCMESFLSLMQTVTSSYMVLRQT